MSCVFVFAFVLFCVCVQPARHRLERMRIASSFRLDYVLHFRVVICEASIYWTLEIWGHLYDGKANVADIFAPFLFFERKYFIEGGRRQGRDGVLCQRHDRSWMDFCCRSSRLSERERERVKHLRQSSDNVCLLCVTLSLDAFTSHPPRSIPSPWFFHQRARKLGQIPDTHTHRHYKFGTFVLNKNDEKRMPIDWDIMNRGTRLSMD